MIAQLNNLWSWVKVSVWVLGTYHLIGLLISTLITTSTSIACTTTGKYCDTEIIGFNNLDDAGIYQQGFEDGKRAKK